MSEWQVIDVRGSSPSHELGSVKWAYEGYQASQSSCYALRIFLTHSSQTVKFCVVLSVKANAINEFIFGMYVHFNISGYSFVALVSMGGSSAISSTPFPSWMVIQTGSYCNEPRKTWY